MELTICMERRAIRRFGALVLGLVLVLHGACQTLATAAKNVGDEADGLRGNPSS